MTPLDDVVKVEIAFTATPWAASHTWTDITSLTDAERALRGVRSLRLQKGRPGPGEQFTPSTLQVVVNNNDGDWDAANTGSVFTTAVARDMPIRVRISDDDFVGSDTIFTGYLDDVVPVGTAQSSTALITASDLFRPLAAFDVDDLVVTKSFPGSRVTDICDAIGVPAGLRGTFDDGTVRMDGTTYKAKALPLLLELARAENGYLYVDGDGVLQFRDRYAIVTDAAWSTSQYTLDDTEIAYAAVPRGLGGFRSVSRGTSSGDTGTTFEFDNTAANAIPSTVHRDGIPALYDADAEVMAEAIQKQHEFTTERIEQIPVRVVPDNTAILTEVEAGTFEPLGAITAEVTPVGFGSVFSYACRVENVTHDIDLRGTWDMTLTVSPLNTTWQTESADWYEIGTTIGATDVLAL